MCCYLLRREATRRAEATIPRNPQPAMGEPFGTAECAFDLALLSVVPEAGCHQDCTGCFGVFSCGGMPPGGHKSQPPKPQPERRSLGTVGMPMTSCAYASRRKGFANPYSTMEPFCTTRRLASLIREQALGEVRRAMHSRTFQKGSGRPRHTKWRMHRPQPRNQGKYLGIGRYKGTKA